MPPKKWDTHDEVKMLLAVISITNPKVPGSAWGKVAAAMGENFTAEAVRQKYNMIKRGAKAAGAGADDTTKNTTPTNPKPTTTTKIPKPTTTTKTLKRKLAVPTVPEDDDEEELAPRTKKSRNIKTEHDNEDPTLGAELFKIEKEDSEGGIDLERDDLYDA